MVTGLMSLLNTLVNFAKNISVCIILIVTLTPLDQFSSCNTT